MRFKGLDLNLLVVLDALLTQRNLVGGGKQHQPKSAGHERGRRPAARLFQR